MEKLSYEIDETDVDAFAYRAAWPARRQDLLVAFIALLLVGGGAYADGARRGFSLVHVLLMLGTVINGVRAWITRPPKQPLPLRRSIELVIDASGIRAGTDAPGFPTRIERDRRRIYFMDDAHGGYVVPARAFASEEERKRFFRSAKALLRGGMNRGLYRSIALKVLFMIAVVAALLVYAWLKSE